MPIAKTTLSQNDLQCHLQEQITFLEASADLFDRGSTIEAKRLAVTIRTLVHDTNKSQSLLVQIKKKDIQFLDTAHDIIPENLVSSHSLVCIAFANGQVAYKARLDNGTVSKYLDFTTWWDKPVLKDKQGRMFTRKGLVLTMANEDGGAHVDPALNSTYTGIKKDNTIGWIVKNDTRENPLMGVESASMRQIAYEILKTLKENI